MRMTKAFKGCTVLLTMIVMVTALAIPAKCNAGYIQNDGIVSLTGPVVSGPEEKKENMSLSEEPATELVGAAQCICGSVEGYARYDLAALYLEEINAYRRSCGAGDVYIDSSLSDYAMQRAAEQVCFYGHTRPDGSGCFETSVFGGTWHGETAWISGANISADMIFNAFHNSPAHDAIMRDGVYKAVGIGIVETKEGYLAIVCDYRSSGVPAALKSGKTLKTWTFNVCAEYFVPAISPSILSTSDGRTQFAVKGNNYTIRTLVNSHYDVCDGVSSVTSCNQSIVDVEDGYLLPKSAGTADLKIVTVGGSYTVKVTVEQGIETGKEISHVDQEETEEKSYEGVYTIQSAKNRSYVVDVSGGSGKSGANIQLYNANESEAQVFIIKKAGDGYYTITNRKSGKLVDVSGGSRRSGANVHQYTANGTAAQLWKIQDNGDGTVTFISKLGTVLDVSGGLMRKGRNIQTYTSNGTLAQKWVLRDKN